MRLLFRLFLSLWIVSAGAQLNFCNSRMFFVSTCEACLELDPTYRNIPMARVGLTRDNVSGWYLGCPDRNWTQTEGGNNKTSFDWS